MKATRCVSCNKSMYPHEFSKVTVVSYPNGDEGEAVIEEQHTCGKCVHAEDNKRHAELKREKKKNKNLKLVHSV